MTVRKWGGGILVVALVAMTGCSSDGSPVFTEAATTLTTPTTPPGVVTSAAPATTGATAQTPSPAVSVGNDRLYQEAEPLHGSVELITGFETDPHTWTVAGGGPVDASSLGDDEMGVACAGFASPEPTFRMQWDGPHFLRVYFLSKLGTDATLIINDGNGFWQCNDDSYSGLNPSVEWTTTGSGTYDIWVGSVAPDDPVHGTLVVTQRADSHPGGLSGLVDPALASQFRGITVDPDFEFSRYFQFITLSGTVDAAHLGEGCAGLVTVEPIHFVDWSGTSGLLRFMLFASTDPTLMVQGPNGEVHCNDDSFGTLHSTVDIIDPVEGRYYVWGGSFVPGVKGVGRLELTVDPDTHPNP